MGWYYGRSDYAAVYEAGFSYSSAGSSPSCAITFQLPAKAPGEIVEHGPSTWTPAILVGDPASAWCRPDGGGHLGSESTSGKYLCPFISYSAFRINA